MTTEKKKSINSFFSTEKDIVKDENVPFQNGEMIKIIKTQEIGIVVRSRILGNILQKSVIIRLNGSNEQKMISITEIEKFEYEEDE